MKIGVIGAGISGLSTSILLKNLGHDVTVFEKNKKISSFGAGIQISSNGSKVLEYIGVLNKAKKVAVIPQKILFFDGERNKNIGFIPLGNVAANRYGNEFMLLHRSDLVEVLKNKAKSLDIDVKFNSNISIERNTENFISLNHNNVKKQFPFAIAADGVKSKIRNLHFSNTKPKFLNQIAYRTLVDSEKVPNILKKNNVNLFLGSKRHIVTYPIKSGKLINFVFCKEQSSWVDNEWNIKATEDDLSHDFSNFPILSDMKGSFEEIFKWGLYGYKPLKTWNIKNLFIIGDASHPFLPYLAQGANQALEDAFEVTSFFKDNNLKINLQKYKNSRERRISKIYKSSNRNAFLFHLENPFVKILRNYLLFYLTKFFPEFLLSKYDWLYGYDLKR